MAAKAGASLIQLNEHFCAFQESALQERHALRDARDELADLRYRFETFRRDAGVNAARQKAESDAARECTEAGLAEAREEIQQSACALWLSKYELDRARRLASTLKKELNTLKKELKRACISKTIADVDRVAAVESCRKAEIERESRDEELRTSREALVAERENYAALMVEANKSRAQNELAEAAKSSAEAELAKTRHDLKETHEALAAEREQYVLLKREVEITREQQKDAQADESRAESELCKIRDDLLLTQRALAAERERSQTFSNKRHESDKHLEQVRAAQEELRTSREALAVERELSTAAKLQQQDGAKLRDELRVYQEALDAERQRSKASVKNIEAAREALARAHKKTEGARTQQGNAQAAKGADLLESVRVLDAERSRSETLSMHSRAQESEQCLKVARAKQECSEPKVGELEDELAKKTLRLKQKDAETRALASDRNVVRDGSKGELVLQGEAVETAMVERSWSGVYTV